MLGGPHGPACPLGMSFYADPVMDQCGSHRLAFFETWESTTQGFAATARRIISRLTFPRYALVMDEAASLAITIRPAVPADSDKITRTFLESAEYHASLHSG